MEWITQWFKIIMFGSDLKEHGPKGKGLEVINSLNDLMTVRKQGSMRVLLNVMYFNVIASRLFTYR